MLAGNYLTRAAGSNSTEGMIIEAAGGINAAAESGIKGNMTTSLEGLIEMDPEIIIITQPRESGGDEFLEDLVTIKVTQEIIWVRLWSLIVRIVTPSGWSTILTR